MVHPAEPGASAIDQYLQRLVDPTLLSSSRGRPAMQRTNPSPTDRRRKVQCRASLLICFVSNTSLPVRGRLLRRNQPRWNWKSCQDLLRAAVNPPPNQLASLPDQRKGMIVLTPCTVGSKF